MALTKKDRDSGIVLDSIKQLTNAPNKFGRWFLGCEDEHMMSKGEKSWESPIHMDNNYSTVHK